MIGLPSRVRPFGSVTMHKLEFVPEGGVPLMRQCDQGGIESACDGVYAAIGS